ncbi:MAG TPA: PfkB family carbohydrate kinase [Candidatus Sulfomarinibacteraceae bacterium]|nr:PfkB family carbohydrate kinase [Candidatus Sulfomarinibacteraceae bacterium]
MTADMTIAVVGSASRDVVRDDPRGWRLGGGVAYGGMTLARLGLPTRVLVGVDALAAGAHELHSLREAGADVRLVRLGRTPIFENIETPDGRIQGCLEPGEPLPVEALPDDWRSAGAWLLAPVADELPGAWAAVPGPGTLVAFGWQGILRDLPAGGQVRRREPAPSPFLHRADIVGVSRHDVDPATPLEGLWHFLAPGAALLVTEGPLGGWEIRLAGGEPAGRRRYPAIPTTLDVDPTGAGDVFLAAYLAARLDDSMQGPEHEGGGLRLAAAAASLNVEGLGLAGVPTLAAVSRRIASTVHGPAAG